MFVDLNELKGLLIDLDTFEEWYDINWTTLDPKVTCLFFSMNEDKLQRIKEMDNRFLTFTGKLFMNSFVSPIHDESLRKVLYKLNLLQVNVALVSMNYDNLISIRSALIGTIFVEPSPSNIPYKILGKLTDFKIHNIEQINEIILRRFTGYIAEVSSIRFNDGDKLISDKTDFRVVKIKLSETNSEIDVVVGGRYFNRRDYRHSFHQLSQRILKNKNSETNQIAIFSPIYKELILSVGEVDGITRVPPKLNQFDRFSAVIDEILNGCDFENYCHALWTTRLFQSQKFMNAEERRANVSGVFDAIDEVAGKHIVLLDDVITSCATIIEASKTLYAKGASKVTVIVLAVNQHADPVLYSQELYCPECHSKMKMRFSTKKDSSAYFGCSKYPSCKNWHSYYSGLRRRRIEGNISRELAWDDIIF